MRRSEAYQGGDYDRIKVYITRNDDGAISYISLSIANKIVHVSPTELKDLADILYVIRDQQEVSHTEKEKPRKSNV